MKKLVFAVMVCLIPFLTGCGVRGVEDGQKGVKLDFGKVQDEPVGTGWAWFCPIMTSIEVWNVKTQQIEEVADVPSSEGLVSQLDVSLLYHVPADKVTSVRKEIGSGYVDTVLVPYMREAIRSTTSAYTVSDLYSEAGRTKISGNILAYLRDKLENRGIIIEDVLIKGVTLPNIFAASIENKLKVEQESLQKQYELQKAEMDAKIAVAEANGVANSNKIIAGSITENYLRYKFIMNLSSTNKEVVYVPTEANLPILEATRNAKQ
jgi:regulator of protease activity HflC (stomatin/prohibitin superfamily)